MRRIKLTLQYVGTHYCGWQIQPNGTSIQSVLQDLLSKILKENIFVMASGRTDSGVHALAQVAHFQTEHEMPLAILQRALNAQLPQDIAVLACEEVEESFHALYSAKLKTYSYLILQSQTPYPLLKPFVWRQWGNLDWDSVEECMALIVGEHDFRSFCASDSDAKTTVRYLKEAKLQKLSLRTLKYSLSGLLGLSGMLDLKNEATFHPEEDQEQLVVLSFQGKGFLKHMVRNLVGTLRSVARGILSVEDFERIFKACDRRQAGMTCPAQGLFLVKVEY